MHSLPDPDNIIYPVIDEDQPIHRDGGFCSDPTCPCHEDQDAIAIVNVYVEEGLLSPQEATDYVAGKPVEEWGK